MSTGVIAINQIMKLGLRDSDKKISKGSHAILSGAADLNRRSHLVFAEWAAMGR